MMLREKKDMKPLALKLGVAVVVSVGGIVYSFLTTNKIKPSSGSGNQAGSSGVKNDNLENTATLCDYPSVRIQNSAPASPSIRSPESFSGKESYLLPEFNEIVHAASKDEYSPRKSKSKGKEKLNYNSELSIIEDQERELRSLKNMVKILEERELNLQFQLLEYCGYREQQTALMELQNRLKIHNVKAKLFNKKIENLQVEKTRLQALLADQSNVSVELEDAKAKIKLLKMKLKSQEDLNKEQILVLKARVMNLPEHEKEKENYSEDPEIELKLRKLNDLEKEREELKKSNSDLRVKNSELGKKLENVQILAQSKVEDKEVEHLKEEIEHLRQENEHLTKEIDGLQGERCTDLEELVYLRWVNACLRYELRNYRPAPGKTIARDLSKTLSPDSEKKAKELILEYASHENDHDQCSASQAKERHTKSKIFRKIRRLLWGKEEHHLQQSQSSLSVEEDMEERKYGSDSDTHMMNKKLRNSSRGTRYSSDEGTLRIFESIESIAEDGIDLSEVKRINEESENFEKSEVVKYAEALKGSHKALTRRRAASFSSFSYSQR